jgi:glucoamylase
MARDLPLGNGIMQVNFDLQHHLADLYYPDVGGENHILGHPFRIGVWTAPGDGSGSRFAWIGDGGWRRDLRYASETLVTDATMEHEGLGVRLHFQECVDFHVNAFLRRLSVMNLAGGPREIRVFFHHDFHISGIEYGDTAYFDPQSRGLFHYKGRRWFHANVRTPAGVGWTQFATGIKEWNNQEGTWRDAEDGILGMNAIAQGSVDSTGGVTLSVPGGGEQIIDYWLLAGTTYEELRSLNLYVQRRMPERLMQRTRNYWHLWVNKESMDFGPLPPEVVAAFKHSLLVVSTQVDHGGAIIASTDSDVLLFGRDTYAYMWPRDGALAARALGLAGYGDLTRPLFQFCADVITREGFLLHKYNPDRSVGSSWHPWTADGHRQFPIQEDETALVLYALWLHFAANRDVEFLKPLYRPLVKKAGDFLATFRDPATGLPRPSYDLWEERHGVHAFTCGAVYAGLMSAANLVEAFGERHHAARYRGAAAEVRDAVIKYLWNPEANRFARMLNPNAPESSRLDMTIDISIVGLMGYGLIADNDPKAVSTMEAIEKRLWVQTPVGGIARYENDYYLQVSKDIGPVPGNPWILCTMWLAEWYIRLAKSADDLARPLELLRWAVDKALPSGVFPEQINPYDGTPISVSPLTWSHAQFIHATLAYLDALHALDRCPQCGTPMYRRLESHLVRESPVPLATVMPEIGASGKGP